MDSRCRGNDGWVGWLGCLLIGLLALAAIPAAAQTFPPLTGRVVDQANIIPDDRETAITAQLEQLQRQTSRQLVVATVSSLEGHEIDDYAYRLGRHWRIGQEEANNGVVLLVAPTERRVWITVGPGLQGFLTDAFTGRVIRERIVPRFRENDYPGGIEAGVNALIEQLAAPPEAAERRAVEAERERQQRETRASGGGGEAWVILVLLVGIFGIPAVLAVANGPGGRRQRVSPWGPRYSRRGGDDDAGWLVAGAVLEGLLRSRSGGSSWGGGSGWSGGFDSGGGGFSGGGGTFDGGGAGGSW